MKKFAYAFLGILLTLAVTFNVACDSGSVQFMVLDEVYHTVADGEDGVALPQAPEKTGYVFNGWYLDNGVWEKPFAENTAVNGNVKIYAKMDAIPYQITYNLNGGVNNLANPATYTVEDEFTFATPSKSGYVFLRWDTRKIYAGTTGNITVTASWSIYSQVDEDNDVSSNGNYMLFGSYPQTEVTDQSLTATLNNLAGALPTDAANGTWTSYGFYNVEGQVSNYTWYQDVSYGSDKFRGVYFTDWRPMDHYSADYINYASRQDDNGYSINTVYWFRYEPLRWNIITKSGGKALLLCDMVIDSQPYDFDGAYSNNYAQSTIRAWLSDNFYNTAFVDIQKDLIATTTVDNSVASTGYETNINVCEDTQDKVFLLSRAQVNDQAYGLGRKQLLKIPTAYAKALGVYTIDSYHLSKGSSTWWLRSPYYDNDSRLGYSCLVHPNGDTNGIGASYTMYYGVVPALWITL